MLIEAKDAQYYLNKLKPHFKLRAEGNASYFLGYACTGKRIDCRQSQLKLVSRKQ